MVKNYITIRKIKSSAVLQNFSSLTIKSTPAILKKYLDEVFCIMRREKYSGEKNGNYVLSRPGRCTTSNDSKILITVFLITNCLVTTIVM